MGFGGKGIWLLAWVAASAPRAWSSPACPNPVDNRPSLSFTLVSYHPGELDRNCANRVAAARASGFTTVALTPTFVFTPGAAGAEGTLASTGRAANGTAMGTSPDEVTRCLEVIRAAGLDVTYQPHVDDESTLASVGEHQWRARFNLHPTRGNQYREVLFRPFLDWMSAHQADLTAPNAPRADVLVASELEYSTMAYPRDWTALTADLRNQVPAALRSRVRMGFNPNHWPMEPGDRTPVNCDAYREFLRGLDFYAPSTYGNWTPVSEPSATATTASNRLADIRRALAGSGRRRCTNIPEFNTLTQSIGEFGVGGSLRETSSPDPLADMGETPYPDIAERRREIYRNVLDVMRGRNSSPPTTMNIWATGAWDQFGIDGGTRDSEIVRMFRAYTSERCPGFQFVATCELPPSLPASPPVSDVDRVRGSTL